METRITRRTFLKKSMFYVLGLIAAAASAAAYSSIGERFWLETKRIKLTSSRLPSVFKGLRIVQISDIHLGNYYDSEDLQAVIRQINQLDPDMIFFTGDLSEDVSGYLHDDVNMRSCIAVLSQLKARFGKWAVLGNHDHHAGAGETTRVLEASGFAVLMNEHKVVELDGHYIYIAGVLDVMYGEADLDQALSGIPGNAFTLLLAHEPDYASYASQYPVDVQFSGHSHGGQVKLPLIGHLYTPPLAKKYFEGLYVFEDSRLQLYVNRGIGTTKIPYRFFCRPEISLFELSNEPK